MKKILVVDDDEGMRELSADILRPNFSVRMAEDGVQGLEMIRQEKPDLVILDLLMPRMHGFEVCKRIRADDALKSVKVLIVSSKSYANDVSTALSLGADKFLLKPYQVDALIGTVDELIGEAKTPLSLRFWGTRGSIASPGPLTQKYGGNTPCTELLAGETQIIIDAGTGLRELGNAMMKRSQGKASESHLFIGHTHWDHIQGFPFFAPAYLPQNKVSLYGVHGTTQGFSEVINGQMNPTYFPVGLRDMASKPRLNELSGPTQLGEVKLTYHYLNHPGITVGFRVETKNWVVSYISDHEPYGKLNNAGEFSAKEDDAVARFVWGSDILISEAQYTDEEYRTRKSWGHSTFSDVLGLAAKAQVKQLALFHHDPMHTDEMMDRYVAECQAHVKKMGYDMACYAAQEGMTLTL
jgi:phosphoribosyl 1,2-cyclic phosphodiesterase/CheY-like chemotaxis protein